MNGRESQEGNHRMLDRPIRLSDSILMMFLVITLVTLLYGAINEKKTAERIEAERLAYIKELQEMVRIDKHEYIKMLEAECKNYDINLNYTVAHARVMTDDFTNDYCLVNHNFGTPEYERVFTDAEEGIRIYVNWFYNNNTFLWNYDLSVIGIVMKKENYLEKMEELLND